MEKKHGDYVFRASVCSSRLLFSKRALILKTHAHADVTTSSAIDNMHRSDEIHQVVTIDANSGQ